LNNSFQTETSGIDSKARVFVNAAIVHRNKKPGRGGGKPGFLSAN
jgi:hypothetical protein